MKRSGTNIRDRKGISTSSFISLLPFGRALQEGVILILLVEIIVYDYTISANNR